MTDELSMEQLLAQEAAQNAAPGEIVNGTIVGQNETHLLVNVGLKQEAAVPLAEFGGVVPAVGAEIPVLVQRISGPEGRPVASWKAGRERKYWTVITQAFEKKEPVEGKITRKVKGGVIVDIGLDAFMPASQIDLKPVGDAAKWLSQTVHVVVLEMDKAKGNVLVSRRRIQEQELLVKRTATLGSLQIGQTVHGKITALTNFGAFVDIGGIEGLLHITDMAWSRVDKPQTVVKVGQELDLKVLKHDPATQRISLGLKQLQVHPWDGIEAKYPVGSMIKGKVKSTAPFGAFVEVAPGIEGLIHVSELSWTERIKDPKQAVKPGQEVDVKVIAIDREKEKLSLSLKRAGQNPWEKLKQDHKPGSQIEGQVSHISKFGAFVKLPSGLEALIRNQDFSWTENVTDASKFVKPGDAIKAVVIDVNVQEEKMALGLKQLSKDPFSSLKIGQVVNGTVSKVLDFGIFVKLEGGFDGFVRANEIEGRGKFDDAPDPSSLYKEGEAITATVIKINKKDRKIDLSIRRYDRDQEKELLKKYSGKNDRATLGDVWNI